MNLVGHFGGLLDGRGRDVDAVADAVGMVEVFADHLVDLDIDDAYL